MNSARTIYLTYLAFMLLGMPSGLRGVAWPSISESFGLPLGALGSLLLAIIVGFLISSFASGYVLARIGSGATFTLGFGLLAGGMLGYALAPSWPMLLAVAVIRGLGSGAIDAGFNTYATLYFSPRVMNWMHAGFGLGATTSPLIMTAILAANRPWQLGYLIVAGGQFTFMVLLFANRNRWRGGVSTTLQESEPAPIARAGALATLRLPVIWLSLIMFAVYAGVEVGIGDWAFTLLTRGRGVSEGLAGLWVSIYWASLTAGRIGFGIILTRFQPRLLMRIALGGLVLGTVLLAIDVADVLSFTGLLLMGVSLAPIFPIVMSATPERIAPQHVTNAVGFQLGAAGIGIGILPGIIGVAVDQIAVQSIGPALVIGALVLVVFYTVLALYGRHQSQLKATVGKASG